MDDGRLIHCSHWWDATKEPYYGDHSSVLGQDGYVYAYGGGNTTLFYDGLYLTRVPHASQTDLSAYEYWNGTQYTPDRIYNPSETEAVLQGGSTQGMITWNPYLNSYLYIYTGRSIFLCWRSLLTCWSNGTCGGKNGLKARRALERRVLHL